MRLNKTLNGEKDERTPVWLMRQAGRYLPEYRALRASEPNFIEYCLNSEKAAEATLQPIDRYGFDAAIIFSDILMIPWAMGANVRFVQGEGPKLDPLENPSSVLQMDSASMLDDLAPVFRALSLTRRKLDPDRNLIGFCGAPWTVATYMIEGGSSRDFERSRQFLWKDGDGMALLMDRLVNDSITYLAAKVEAGADTLMIFDSWASAVPSPFIQSIVIEPTRRIIAGLRDIGITVPVIGFPKGVGEGIIPYAEQTGISAIGLDHGVDARWADRNLPRQLAVQGNLDPVSLMEGGPAMLASVDGILDAFSTRPHIFNLGHGIGQHTPPEHVNVLIDHLRKN